MRRFAHLCGWVLKLALALACGGGLLCPATASAEDPHKAIKTPAAWKAGEAVRPTAWGLTPVTNPAVPAVKDAGWPRTELDRFVLATMEAQGLKPVGDADRAVLLRRVSYDLVGLPPTPQEIEAFVADKSPHAFETVVDRLLASPQFGERWGRHWLDVARYAESTGSSRNYPYHYAWRYRDWVIDALNRDKPYDQFIREQIAGDLLPARSPAQRDQQQIATGFLAVGVKDLNEKNHAQYVMDVVDDQIDVTSRAVLGLTVACARCHDHKFDPISQSEYYGLAGIFRSTDVLAGVTPKKKGGNKDYGAPEQLIELGVGGVGSSAVSRAVQPKAELSKRELRKARKADLPVPLATAAPAAPITPVLAAPAATDPLSAALEHVAADVADTGPSKLKGQKAMGVRDDSAPGDVRLCIHGDVDTLGDTVPRGFVHAVTPVLQSTFKTSGSGRLELAHWLTRPENPLTARVEVNRIWMHLFGQGIVPTTDNFGAAGEPPSDPRLLDHLASQFVADGWSVKKMIRTIVLSRVYQLGSEMSVANAQIDGGNRFLWRSNQRRLDAEAIRDSMLAASGSLSLARPGPSPVMLLPNQEINGKKGRNTVGELENSSRSVYLPILRGDVPKTLDTFDFGDPSNLIARRDVTTVPSQALFMMNSTRVMDQSRLMAQALLAVPGLDDVGRIELGYRRVFGRSPSESERDRGVQFICEANGPVQEGQLKNKKADGRLTAWSGFCQALLGSAEFRYVQ